MVQRVSSNTRSKEYDMVTTSLKVCALKNDEQSIPPSPVSTATANHTTASSHESAVDRHRRPARTAADSLYHIEAQRVPAMEPRNLQRTRGIDRRQHRSTASTGRHRPVTRFWWCFVKVYQISEWKVYHKTRLASCY